MKVLGILFTVFSLIGPTTGHQRGDGKSQTRDLLVSLNDVRTDRASMAELFRTGDDRIEDLIRLLDDPERDVSLRAQVIIRYLGNETGRTALSRWFANHTGPIWWAGPVPIPLNDWDYANLDRYFVNKPVEEWTEEAVRYLYALRLDPSPKSNPYLALLDAEAAKQSEGSYFGYASRRIQNAPTTFSATSRTLAAQVHRNAFFLDPDSRAGCSVRLIAFNGAGDKALLQVHIGNGALNDEWHHVVVKRELHRWHFYSITLIASS